jgi:hypothetical protein
VLIAEREKYWPTPRRSPPPPLQDYMARPDQVLDGAVNGKLSNWNYSKNGKFYKWAPSGYLIIDTAKIFFIRSSLTNS